MRGLKPARQRGSLSLEAGGWRLRIRLPLEPGEKRRRSQSIQLGTLAEIPTKRQARAAADRYLAREAPAQLHAGRAILFSEWCDLYLARHTPMLASGSRATQASIIRRHLSPAFGARRVHEIEGEAVQGFILEQLAAGAGRSTIRARFNVLRRMLRQAKADGLAATPPLSSALRFPKDEAMHDGVRQKAFPRADCQRILEAAPLPDRAAYALALYAGLRAGEVLGLRWEAISLDAGTVLVTQQAIDGIARPLKTRGSRATLRAPAPLRVHLQALHDHAAADGQAPAGFLFRDPGLDTPWSAPELRERLVELLEALGIRRRGMHGFRHACALAMADAGCSPEVIRRAMRHSSLAVTSIYLTAAPEDIAAGLERGAATIIAPKP